MLLKRSKLLVCVFLLFLTVQSHGQRELRKADFYLKQITVNGLPFKAPLKKVRELWGKEDSSSNAIWHDEMSCFTRYVGDSLMPATFYFFPGLLYWNNAGDSVSFQSVDFDNPKSRKAEIGLPKIKVTAKTTAKQILAAYPMAERIDDPKENEVGIVINTKDADEENDIAVIFKFYKGKLKEVLCRYNCA